MREKRNSVPRTRLRQFVLIASTLLASWLGMQVVHELGHVIAAWLTGGRVAYVILDPRTISRTELAHNPNPLPVIWTGPVFGAAAPVVIWQLAVALRSAGAFLLRFFAGFCLVANGLYIGIGSFGRIGDAGDLLQHGVPAWQLWVFGMVKVPPGLWLWNGEGHHFGFGTARGNVNSRVVLTCVITCLVFLTIAFASLLFQ